jgi:hypothetical protein
MPWWVLGEVIGSGANQEIQQIVVFRLGEPSTSGGHIDWVLGPYSKAQADAVANNQSPQTPKQIASSSKYHGAGGTQSLINDATGGVNSFVKNLASGHTWTRVIEVVMGIGLAYIAAKAIVTPPGRDVARQTVKHTGRNIKKVARAVVVRKPPHKHVRESHVYYHKAS